MMTKRLGMGMILCALPVFLSAQVDSIGTSSTPDSTAHQEDNAALTVHMDPELSRYIALMDSLDMKQQKTFGYRIQIFSSSGPTAKKDALKSQSEFLKLHSEHSAYTAWDYPNWVVRLGDYRNHLEAQEFHDEIKVIYPASFIVKDEIKVD
jgi:hypothetical protein